MKQREELTGLGQPGLDNFSLHQKILNELHDTYIAKNNDYGNSVHDTYEKYGLVSFLVRLEDKLNRARTLMTKDSMVENEAIEDTLIDMANYAILAAMEIKGYKEKAD